MSHLPEELWDTEEEEEEEEEGSSPEDSPAESEESCCEDGQEWGRGCQEDPPIHCPLQWRPRERRCCRRRLFAPYDLQGEDHSPRCTGHRRDRGSEAHPWGRGSPPWDPHLGSWVRDAGAVCQSNWHLEQAAASPRTLSHPSFQAFFAAVSTCSRPCLPSPGGRMVPQPSGGGPLPLVDCSGFFYTDPTLPPGYRIYNCLSASSQEVLRSLPLNTPAPIMCPCPAAAAGRRWLSDPECRAVSALLALPASGGGNASSGPAPGAAAACGETDATASCP